MHSHDSHACSPSLDLLLRQVCLSEFLRSSSPLPALVSFGLSLLLFSPQSSHPHRYQLSPEFSVLVDCYIRCSLALSYSRLSWSTNMADRAPLMTVNYFKLLLLHFHNQTSHDSWELSPGSNIHGVLHRKKNRLNFSKMGCTPRWKGSTTVRGQVNYTAKDTGNRSVAEMETNYRSQLLE